ncbi:MAG: tRNA guanosine(34) transglycosylase Tgt [Patescibacteria group bacterium]|nr:tRNA guanosine(34) transglycosylase Tgt [Patescibacteria group bacterium]
MFNFKIIKRDKKTKARLGLLKTPHGVIYTPNLAIVGTKGAIRGISFEKAKKFGAEIFMINTFHFFHNERYKIVEKFGGLHKFLNIDYPLMTDSGGFQVFSLGFGMEHGVGKIANIFPSENKENLRNGSKNLVKIYDEGVKFISPYDGKKLFLTPELSIKIQKILGADIIFSFDECTSALSGYDYTKLALKRTHSWAVRCLKAFGNNKKQIMFGIVQGGEYEDLRKESAKFINSLPFFGFGIGGSLGKSKKDIIKVLNWTLPYLDENKPRHLLGIGEVDDILNSVELGIDLFDCVIPTRWARHGTVFTFKGRLNLKSSRYLKDRKPIDVNCHCEVCKKYTRAYICHLFREKEIYAVILMVEHNIFWILNLFKEIRKAIKMNKFLEFKRKIMNKINK